VLIAAFYFPVCLRRGYASGWDTRKAIHSKLSSLFRPAAASSTRICPSTASINTFGYSSITLQSPTSNLPGKSRKLRNRCCSVDRRVADDPQSPLGSSDDSPRALKHVNGPFAGVQNQAPSCDPYVGSC
jgi:hypothetical protein